MIKKRQKEHVWSYRCGGWGFGVFLLLLGIIWLARDAGWIPNIPIFPVVLILIGLCIIVSKLQKTYN